MGRKKKVVEPQSVGSESLEGIIPTPVHPKHTNSFGTDFYSASDNVNPDNPIIEHTGGNPNMENH